MLLGASRVFLGASEVRAGLPACCVLFKDAVTRELFAATNGWAVCPRGGQATNGCAPGLLECVLRLPRFFLGLPGCFLRLPWRFVGFSRVLSGDFLVILGASHVLPGASQMLH